MQILQVVHLYLPPEGCYLWQFLVKWWRNCRIKMKKNLNAITVNWVSDFFFSLYLILLHSMTEIPVSQKGRMAMMLLLVTILCFQRFVTECFLAFLSPGYKSQRYLSLMVIKTIFSVRTNGIQRWYVQAYVHDSHQLNIEVWFLLQSKVRSRFIRLTSGRSVFFTANEKITALENVHKVCDDILCPEKIFYSKHFCLFLLNYNFVVIIFLRWSKAKYIHQR